MQCPHIPEIPYMDFSTRVHEKGLEKRLPVVMSLELTERCNLNCAHCYINRPAGEQEAQVQELTTRQWRTLLDEMAEAGALWTLFTGGEPLLRPDFCELYAHAKRLGMIVTIFTNATLITPELADFLLDWPPFMVEVTVYGNTPETFEAVTRVPGSYQRCLQGIDILMARGLPIRLKTMAMTLNVHELGDLKVWAESLGLPFRYDPLLNARLDGGKELLNLRLPPEEVVRLDLQDEEASRYWERLWADFPGLPEDEGLFPCGAGLNGCHVDAYGNMHICMMVRKFPFNLVRGSFREGWNQFLPPLLQMQPDHDSPCHRCKLLIVCDQCPGWSHLEGDDLVTPVAYLCQVAHLRAKDLGIKIDDIGSHFSSWAP
jgi:radical SAM protein with 4Fe4S-binding SPASM domain